MSHQSDLISTDIDAYLAQHERKELLKLLTCGSVDDGKSTLIGRLLHDSKLIYEDQLEAIKADSIKSGTTEGEFDLSLLVDGLQAEREQGITIDVAYRYFSTAKRKFIIADTPGHEQYTRNMATGASTCDLAIILIDARHGILTQTRRHSFITSLLGIKHVIVAINKMDLVDFDKDVYDRIQQDYLDFSQILEQTDCRFIPISALHGDNVVNISDKTPWYSGDALMTILENIEIAADHNYVDMRFPVQYVNRPNLNFRGYCGTLASGVVHKGDIVTALPSGKTSKIKSIVTYDEELEQAFTPMAITLTLEDEIDISRGDMLVHTDNMPSVQDKFEATVVWMTDKPMLPGTQYDFKHTNKNVSGHISTLKYKIDMNTLKEELSPSLQLNEIGRCEIYLDQPICFDSYKMNRSTGAFIIVDRLSNVTIGAGMIVDAQKDDQKEETTRAAYQHRDSVSHVTREERAARYGQKPVTVLFIGLSGSGKTTLAHALERRLFDMGRVSTVLDGKTMRLGISKDLAHDKEGRVENLRRSVYIAKHLNDSGLICCGAFVAPDQESREHALETIGKDNCFIVYLNPPLEICKQRDPSGLYAAEENVETGTLPGVSFPYKAPENADLVLATDQHSIDACTEKVIEMLKAKEVI
ncbi:MAG: sulfate adenylyltransferase subunit CysN [Proteobacteria bacterium]|nr:sulfate adenylyltransferase subunit CysN [Pseudomonadota bacterium]